MSLKVENKNTEVLEEFISQISILERIYFNNAKSQILKV